MNKNFFVILGIVFFFISRIYILKFPPPFYSDVFHDYRRYAEMWASGITPYFKHLYEYPPATIPLLYFPEILNLRNIGHYYQNYRFQIFVLDAVIFIFILQALLKLKTKPTIKYLSLGFYLIAPMIAKDFFYDGIDWMFIGSLALALIFYSRRLIFWLFFWLSVNIKLLTAPLAPVFLWFKTNSLKQEIKTCALAFIIIWGLPLAIFRSSLSVMLFFNQVRGIKYAAFPSFIVETINDFTKTETRLNQPPDFQLQGPVSDIANKVVGIIFPLSIALVLAYGLWKVIKHRQQTYFYTFGIKISLIYIFTIFFTAKIFSQPFHLWYIPLITLFPFKSIKRQLTFFIPAFILLIVDTTPWIKPPEALMIISPLPLKFFSYLFLRYVPMGSLLYSSFKLPNK